MQKISKENEKNVKISVKSVNKDLRKLLEFGKRRYTAHGGVQRNLERIYKSLVEGNINTIGITAQLRIGLVMLSDVI